MNIVAIIVFLIAASLRANTYTGEDMARYFGKQKDPKPASPGAKRVPEMENGKLANDTAFDLGKATPRDRTSAPIPKAEAKAGPRKDAAAPPAKGMGVGKPLLTKSFTDGGDKFKITVTKEK